MKEKKNFKKFTFKFVLTVHFRIFFKIFNLFDVISQKILNCFEVMGYEANNTI